MVLKHSLGGNSRTVMLAAVSPSSLDYEETISTLKYADNTKKIRLRVAANVTSGLLASDGGAMQLVPILQAEVKKLRELLQQQQIQQHKFTSSSHQSPNSYNTETNNETMELVDQMRARVQELEEQLKDREELIKNLQVQQSFSDNQSMNNSTHEDEDSVSVITTHTMGTYHSTTTHRSQPYVVLADDAIDTTLPRLINLNQDPLFSECLVYYIPQGQAIAGSSEVDVDILLSAPDILPTHCFLCNDKDEVYIYPANQTAKIYVNGLLLQSNVVDNNNSDNNGISNNSVSNNKRNKIVNKNDRYYLRHFDRVSMGRYHLFRFEACGRRRSISETKGTKSSLSRSTPTMNINADAPGWDFAHDELMLNKDSLRLTTRSRSPSRNDTSEHYPPGYFNSITNTLSTNNSSESEVGERVEKKKIQRNQSMKNNQQQQQQQSNSLQQKIANRINSSYSNDTKQITKVPSDDWWEKVSEVVDNPKKVNTPAELRAMLRSVMESAEKKMEQIFPTNQSNQQIENEPSSSSSTSTSTSLPNNNVRSQLKQVTKQKDSLQSNNDEIKTTSKSSKSRTSYLMNDDNDFNEIDNVNHNNGNNRNNNVNNDDLLDQLPPPPPPTLVTSTILLPSKSEEISIPSGNSYSSSKSLKPSSSSSTVNRIKLPSNSTSTVDILIAERRSTSTLSSSYISCSSPDSINSSKQRLTSTTPTSSSNTKLAALSF